jgi:hypothetical protein
MFFTDRLKMFSSRNEKRLAYPDVPGSLRSESIELSEYKTVVAARADTSPYITPYLGLRARLSQIWINRWTILLLLVLVRVILLIANLNDNIGDAKVKALSACSKVEDIGSAMASMPHYLSVGVNELAATGIEKAVDGMVAMLDMSVTVIQNLIIFIINMMTATYTCLITAFIHGGLDAAASATKEVTDAMNKVIGDITNGLQNDATNIQNAINKFASAIEGSIFGKILPDVPKADLSKPISDLRNIKIDTTGFVSDVKRLNANLPTFAEVQNFTERAISFPFELIRQEINQSYSSYVFDRSVFPVAQKQQLTFCSNNNIINDFFQHLYDLARTAKIVYIVVISLLAILVCIPMAWIEIKRYRRQQKHAKVLFRSQYDPMDVIYISSRPMSATWGIKIASRFKGRRQILVRWAIAYATSIPAIFVLSLALAGFFSCLCQWIILKAIQREVPALASQVGNFAGEVVGTLEDVSEKWAVDANGVILAFNREINDDVLGYVTNGTSAVNNTLNTFISTMNTGLETAFNNTILINPIKDVMNCLVGLKVASVQKGLTWVHDHAHINFPLFANDTFSLGAAKSISGDSDLTTFLASPSSVTTDEVTGAVDYITNTLHNGIIQEALISTGLILVYVIVVLIGVLRALTGMAMPDRGRAEGGLRYTGEDRPPRTPGSPRRSQSEKGSRFPQFGSDEASGSAVEDQRYPDEKITGAVSGGKAREVQGHARSSSYGHFDSANKF